jgi:hypothetical protein
MRALAVSAALAAFAAACSPPKYVSYRSVSRDFSVAVPWGWNVIADAAYDSFSQVTFVGPEDIDFYLGAPSLSVRWYKSYRPHRLRDGRLEMYASAADFIKQTLDDVYGKDAIVYGIGTRPGGGRALVEPGRPIPELPLRESGLPAKFFGVLAPTPAGVGVTVGTVKDESGRLMNVRYHEYAVVPIDVEGREVGFYVLCYPATQAGHDKGLDRFRALVNTFHPFTAGPGGGKIRVPGPQAERS